jgi:hypothetical protein
MLWLLPAAFTVPDPIELAQDGPVAILVVFIFAIVAGFLRQWVVPGWLYRQERTARLKAEATVERLTRAAKTVPTDDAGSGT